MKYKDFEDYLMSKFIEYNTQVLDDEIPDAFGEWLENQDVQEIINYADEYKKLT